MPVKICDAKVYTLNEENYLMVQIPPKNYTIPNID